MDSSPIAVSHDLSARLNKVSPSLRLEMSQKKRKERAGKKEKEKETG